MRRFLHLCGALMLAVMLWTSSTAHAREVMGCAEASGAIAGHYDGDADQVPADSDQSVPHHHGGCHGHHVAVSSTDGSCDIPVPSSLRGRASEHITTGCDPGSSLRPPIA
jgi:hypothetical protein